MKNLEKISEELFAKIRGRFPSLTIGDANGKITNDPQQARFFDFDYTVQGVDLGKVTISLSEDDGVVIVFSNDLMVEVDKTTQTQWFEFLKELRMFAKKRLLNFDTRDITRSNLKTRDFKFLATNNSEEDTMTESKLYGTSKLSYQDFDGARLVIKHNQAVNPDLASSRTQNISKIYIESADGERFIYPYRHLNGARAMARHVAEGGNPYDDFGGHITGLSEEISKLRKFKNYMGRSNVMAEGLSGYVDTVIERIDTIKKTVESLQRRSFYQEAVQNFETPVFEDVPDEVKENWIDQLTIRQFNEELADVFPYIYKLVSETTLAEEIGPEDLLGEGQDVDEDTVRELLKDFDERAQEFYNLSGDVNPETVIRHLEQGDVEAAIEVVKVSYYDDDGSPGKGFDLDLEELRDDFQAVVDRENDDEYDGQPSDYDELQDLHGGDDYDFGQFENAIEGMMGQFGEGDKKDVLFQIEDEDGDQYEVVKYMGQVVAFDTNPEELPGGGMGPYEYDPKTGIIELDSGPKKTRKIGDQTFDEADFEKNFTKRIAAKAKGGKGAEYYSDKADQTRQQNQKLDPSAAKTGRGIGVLNPDNINKKRAKRGLRPTSNFRTSPNTRDPKRLPEEEQQLPLGEKILSYFDRETGQFPKGETAVLTMVEKDYGEEYIEPAKQFIEMINNKVAEMYGYKDNDLEEGGFFDPDQPNPGDRVKHRNGVVGKVKTITTQDDETWINFKGEDGEMYFGQWKKHVFPMDQDESVDEASRTTNMRYPTERFSKELNTQDFELSSMYDHRSVDQLYRSLNVANNAIQKDTLRIEKLKAAGKKPIKSQQALDVNIRRRDYISDLIDQKEMQDKDDESKEGTELERIRGLAGL